MNNSEYVDNSELLYRWIQSNEVKKNNNPDHYTLDESDNILIDRAAFLAGVKPSVDRAKLILCPIKSKGIPSDGVIGIWTKDVEDIRLRGYPDYTVRVKIADDNGNRAHAEIVLLSKKDKTEQNKMSDGLRRLFRKVLAEISVCLIEPNPR